MNYLDINSVPMYKFFSNKNGLGIMTVKKASKKTQASFWKKHNKVGKLSKELRELYPLAFLMEERHLREKLELITKINILRRKMDVMNRESMAIWRAHHRVTRIRRGVMRKNPKQWVTPKVAAGRGAKCS